MNYNKPEIAPRGCALIAIQGNDKPVTPMANDNQPPYQFTATIHAYEADE